MHEVRLADNATDAGRGRIAGTSTCASTLEGRQSVNRQVEIKCEQIARMVVKGLPKTKIAIEMGMSYDGILGITRNPDYLRIEESVRKGVVDRMDARLAKRASMDGEMEDMVPEALRVVLDQVIKKRDLRAALEVLDRDPRRQFAKSTARAAETLAPGAPVLTSDQLNKVVTDADITHQMLERQRQATAAAQAEVSPPPDNTNPINPLQSGSSDAAVGTGGFGHG